MSEQETRDLYQGGNDHLSKHSPADEDIDEPASPGRRQFERFYKIEETQDSGIKIINLKTGESYTLKHWLDATETLVKRMRNVDAIKADSEAKADMINWAADQDASACEYIRKKFKL